MNTQQLSRLMRVSWEIQRRRKTNRSQALILAWSIFFNADILVYYLHARHSRRNNTKPPPAHYTYSNHSTRHRPG